MVDGRLTTAPRPRRSVGLRSLAVASDDTRRAARRDPLEEGVPVTNPNAPPLVWAVNTRHAPLFWFPETAPEGASGLLRPPGLRTARGSLGSAPPGVSTSSRAAGWTRYGHAACMPIGSPLTASCLT